MNHTINNASFHSLLLCILIILHAAPSNAVPSVVENQDKNQPLDIAEMERISNQIRNHIPKDQFDTPPVISNLTGKPFLVSLSPLMRGPENSICSGYPSLGYYPNKQQLEVSYSPETILISGSSNHPFGVAIPKKSSSSTIHFLNFVSITCDQLNSGTYNASNAFGVTTTVKKTTDRITAISDQIRPEIGQYWAKNPYWSKSVSGENARGLAESIIIRIKGEIGTWPNGSNVLCGYDHHAPKINWPYDETLDACIFKVTNLKFEVIDTRINEVLYNSTNATKKKK